METKKKYCLLRNGLARDLLLRKSLFAFLSCYLRHLATTASLEQDIQTASEGKIQRVGLPSHSLGVRARISSAFAGLLF